MFLVMLTISAYVGTSSLNLAKSASQKVSQTVLLSQVNESHSKYIKAQQRLLELLFTSVANDVDNLRTYTQNLFVGKDLINTKKYWDSNDHLIHLDNNQLIDISTDISTLWSPVWMDVNPAVIKKIEVSAYLNEYFEPLLKRNKYTIANYFLGKEGFLRYYPRINMIDVFAEDLRTVDAIYFKPASPEQNPQKKLVWTPLYKDPAAQGWMISAIAPIYVKGEFIGVVGTDVTLDLLVEHFINTSNTGSSYSMLLDDKLRPIALSQKATQDIYRTESFLDDAITQQSLLDYDSDFKSALKEDVSLEQGFRKITLADRNVYISFTRLTELNWFYAEIVDESEIMGTSQILSTKIDGIVDNLILKLCIPMLLSFAILTFTLILLANKFVKPIVLLSKLTQKIAQGNFQQKIQIRADGEVGQLISDFSLMQESLNRHQRSLENQLEFQQLLMKTVNTPIFIKNDIGILIDCNHAFAVFVGNSIEEIKGRYMSEVVGLDFFEVNTNSDNLLIYKGGEDSFIRKIRNAAGEFKDLVFEKNAYLDENGDVKWIVGTFFDVTELNEARHKAESFNEELQLKVDERTRELELINSKLTCSLANLSQTKDKLVVSEKMASLGSMVAGISHELNTPIGIALTGISSLFDKVNNMKYRHEKNQITNRYFDLYLDETMELSTIILSNIERAVDLITSFKKVSVDQTSETIRSFNVSLYMQDIIKSITNILKRNQVQVNISCAQYITINSYPGSLYQVITNLIINSITHGFSEPCDKEKIIQIDIALENNDLRVKFKDNGRGIPPKNLLCIFDPFFTTNRENGGTGLGLHIVYNIVSIKLDGTITCCSTPGISTEFDILISTCVTTTAL
jgi:PAS domain S-box-containing protein